MIKVFQNKFLRIIFVVFFCLPYFKTTSAADNITPRAFSSAVSSKSASIANNSATKSLSSSVESKTVSASGNNATKALSSSISSKSGSAQGNNLPKAFSSSTVSKVTAISDEKSAKSLSSSTFSKTALSDDSKVLKASPIADSKEALNAGKNTLKTLESPVASKAALDTDNKMLKTLPSATNSKTATTATKDKTEKTFLSSISSLFSSSEKEEEKTVEEEVSDSPFALSKAPEYIGAVTFEADEEQLSAMPLVKGVYELASEAQTMHNTKQQLPSMRKPFFEYEKMKRQHEEAVGRLYTSVLAARDYFAHYYGESKANDLWFGKGCRLKMTVLGQKCAKIKGCRKPYKAKEFQPAVKYNIVCQDEVFSLTDYPKMRGLLGQSVSAYKLAKAEAATELDINPDNFAEAAKAETGTPVIDMNLSALGDSSDSDGDSSDKVTGTIQSGKTLSQEELSATGGGIVSNPEKDASSQAAMREQDLVRWQIGSAAAKKVGQDMASGGNVYGVPDRVYPLWEDEKRVYNQYLREKYKNIELYFSSNEVSLLDFDIAEALNQTFKINEAYIQSYRETLVGEMLESSEINSKVATLRAQLEEELEALKDQNSVDIQAAKDEFVESLNGSSIADMKANQENEVLQLEQKAMNDVASIKSAIQQKYNEIDEILARLNKTKDEYQDKLSQQEDAKSLAKAQDTSMKLEDEKAKEDPKYVSGFKNDAIATKLENLKIVVDLQPQINALKAKIDEDQNKVNALRAAVSVMEMSIDTVKKAHIRDVVLMENKHHQEMKEALAARNVDASSPSSILSEVTNMVLAASSPFNAVMLTAKKLRSEFQTLAIAEVRSAYQEISSFENLYSVQTYPKILARHQKMIENIEKIQKEQATVALTKFVFGGAVFGTTSFPLFECEDCENEDGEYYVGFEGTKKDFLAPKRLAASYTPPLREVMHFDATDFDGLSKYEPEKGEVTYACPPIGCPSSANPKVTKAEFLKLGDVLPDIWKRILMPGGFVERDIDVEDILMDGAEPRCGGGFMPSTCPSTKVENLSRAFIEAKGESFVPGVGELSVFFKYDNGLTFTDAIMDLYDESANMEDNFKGDDNPTEEQINEYAELLQDLDKRFLARTQVGDVLQFVNMEQIYQVGMDKLKVKIDETRRTLDEFIEKLACEFVLKDTDYLRPGEEATRIVSSEYLADDETYEAISACLDNGKNEYIRSALNLEKELPVLSDELKGQKKKSDDMLLCMQKDSEEWVVLSDDTSPSTEFDEQIKTQRVNAQASDRYQEEGNKQMEKGQNIPSAYRANFGPGDPYIP